MNVEALKISFILIAERKSLLPCFPGCHWKNLQSAAERVQEGKQPVCRGMQVPWRDMKDLYLCLVVVAVFHHCSVLGGGEGTDADPLVTLYSPAGVTTSGVMCPF